MKHLFLTIILTGLFSSPAFAQVGKQEQAWEIIFKSHMETLAGATKEEIKKANEFNAKQDSVHIKYIVSDSLYRAVLDYNIGSVFHTVVNRRDSIAFTYFEGRNTVYVQSYGSYLTDLKEDKDYQIINIQKVPDGTTTVLGLHTKNWMYDLVVKLQEVDTVNVVLSATQEIPDWHSRNMDISGFPLKTVTVNGMIKIVQKAVSIKRVPIKKAYYFPPEGYTVKNKDEEDAYRDSDDKPRDNVYQQAKDSLLTLVKSIKVDSTIQSAGVYSNGFARVEAGGRSYSINHNGVYIFDEVVNKFHPINSIKPLRPGWVSIDRNKKIYFYIVRKEEKYGLLDDAGEWLLRPEYDAIRIHNKRRLAIYKNGKMGYADTHGEIALPPRFDEVNIMGSHYYDVRQGDKWGIYSRDKQKMITPFVYDGFDFCGGCGGTVGYAYASKNGKWGVLGFDGTVLVPFEFEHPGHYGMRSDNWVTSFEKNSVDVVINTKTNSAYSANDYEHMRVINGILALNKNGKFGFVTEKGKLIDFIYDDVSDPYDNFTWGPFIDVYINGKQGIIRNDGKVVIPADTYDEIWVMGDYFVVQKDEKAGLLDSLGQQVLPLVYDEVNGSYDLKGELKSGKTIQLYQISKDSLSGFYNPDNGVLVKPQYDRLTLVMNPDSTRFYVEAAIKWGEDYYDVYKGLYSLSGKQLMSTEYNDYHFISKNLVEVKKEDSTGVYALDTQQEVVAPHYDFVNKLNDRYLLMTKYGDDTVTKRLWDGENRTFLEHPFDRIGETARGGVITVSDSTHEYLFSLKKQKVVSKGYEYVSFPEKSTSHLVRVYKDGKYGYINLKGKTVLPLKYDAVEMSDGGVLRLSKELEGNIWADRFVDSSGNAITAQTFKRSYYDYNQYSPYQAGKFILITALNKTNAETLYGIMDMSGKIIIAPKYEKILYLVNGKGFIVQQGYRFGILDENGNEIMPVVLDNVFFRGYTDRLSNLGRIEGEFPMLCELDGTYFYVTHVGEILPFVATRRK